ncbi:hypothetical protein I8J29_02615 [Paenibacillus sp. MWE-103]|uniref:Uncharacterized protein n=1 Tax=Paenibacillus artemisiicola TaxID=1172618 RepID=A0ABS3W446_9BACL|nr:hypothetical protein [Paenibacillus artemisiicola]MBO7743074.1 hypothetical protein [Paenibacillus artemisiicola]
MSSRNKKLASVKVMFNDFKLNTFDAKPRGECAGGALFHPWANALDLPPERLYPAGRRLALRLLATAERVDAPALGNGGKMSDFPVLKVPFARTCRLASGLY